MADKQNRIQLNNMERPSRSLELLAKFVKTEAERNIVVNNSERIQWDADAYIKTEAGKAWYYSMLQTIKDGNEVQMRMLLGELANLKFKVEE